MQKEVQAKPRLNRQDWIDAGIQELVDSGIGGVNVERLAIRLGVTRGSFYHHFSDRESLLKAMLDHWAEHWTYEVRERIAALVLDPATTLLALSRAIREYGAANYDAPFRAWALHDPVARKVVRKVDQARLQFIQSRFEALGFTGLDAENRARLFLYYEVAAPAMVTGLSSEMCEQLLMERHRFLTTARIVDGPRKKKGG